MLAAACHVSRMLSPDYKVSPGQKQLAEILQQQVIKSSLASSPLSFRMLAVGIAGIPGHASLECICLCLAQQTAPVCAVILNSIISFRMCSACSAWSAANFQAATIQHVSMRQHWCRMFTKRTRCRAGHTLVVSQTVHQKSSGAERSAAAQQSIFSKQNLGGAGS